jgi:transposase InsO family protein
MPWRAVTAMSQRYEFCIRASEPGCNISELCRRTSISRDIGYKWLRRYREGGLEGLIDRSRQPHHFPGRSSSALESAVIALRRKYPYWGPRKLRTLLQDELLAEPLPAISTVARILKRQGLINPMQPEPVWPSVGRFERGSPNELWQMDLKAAIRLPDRRKIYPVGIIDDHSRYLISLRMIPDFSAESVLDCWIRAVVGHGLPESTLTDHGAQFRLEDESSSAFRVYLWACGVEHTQGRVKHRQTQGKIERLWGTLKRELLSRKSYRDIISWQACFDDWRDQYNHLRPHQELGDEPPAKRYRISQRSYSEPDRHQWSGESGSQARRVSPRGQIVLGGRKIMIGRGYAGWTVEAKPLGQGCWHVYFRGRFVRELLFTAQD